MQKNAYIKEGEYFEKISAIFNGGKKRNNENTLV